MHRTTAPGCTVDNKFTDGDPLGVTEATEVNSDYLNVVQEELANLVEGAGLELDDENNAQLLAAILLLTKSSAGRSGPGLAWASTSSFTLGAGSVKINGATYTTTGITKSISGLGLSNSTYYWIYAQAPSTGDTLSASEITLSSTAPTWDSTKNGWYDATGDKVCLWLGERGWVVHTDGSGNLDKFIIIEDRYYWDVTPLDVSTQAPSNAWTDYTFSVPHDTVALLQLQHQYVNAAVTLCWRPKGSSSSQGIRTITSTTGNNGSGHYLVPVNVNRVAQFCFTGATTNQFSAYTCGFQI